MTKQTNKATVQLHKTQIIEFNALDPHTFVIKIERIAPHKAGQVIGISLAPDGDPRLYSIVSGENQPFYEILFTVKKSGLLTPHLSECKVGDPLFVTPPFGSFFATSEPAFLIANGTGIAPYVSMWRSGYAEGKFLVHGSRTAHGFYYADEAALNFADRYIACCSQEEGAGNFSGRVTDYLRSLKVLPRGQKYYLCGSAEMVVECREILLSAGIAFDNIVAEIYF